MYYVKSKIKLLVLEMKLMVLNKDVVLINVSITDGRRLILHYIDIVSFFTAVILKTIQNGR